MSKKEKQPSGEFLFEIKWTILPRLENMQKEEDAHRLFLSKIKAPLEYIKRSKKASKMIEVSYSQYSEYLKKWEHLL